MKTEKSGVYAWLDAATNPIKFGPDRRAARRELLDHIIDRAEAYQAHFPELTAGEAERRAVEDMGDPEPVGRELAAIHKPWLGWLWLICRRALCVLAVALFLCAATSDLWGEPHHKDSFRQHMWNSTAQTAVYPEQSVRVGDYTLELTRARREEYRFEWDDTGEELKGHQVYLTLRMTAKWPWDRPDHWNEGIFRHLRAVDSTGREAGFCYDRTVMDRSLPMWDERPIETGNTALRWQEFELIAYNVDPEARWIELRHDFGGQTFTLRVELSPEPTGRNGHSYGPGTITEEEWAALKAVTEGGVEP